MIHWSQVNSTPLCASVNWLLSTKFVKREYPNHLDYFSYTSMRLNGEQNGKFFKSHVGSEKKSLTNVSIKVSDFIIDLFGYTAKDLIRQKRSSFRVRQLSCTCEAPKTCGAYSKSALGQLFSEQHPTAKISQRAWDLSHVSYKFTGPFCKFESAIFYTSVFILK